MRLHDCLSWPRHAALAPSRSSASSCGSLFASIPDSDSGGGALGMGVGVPDPISCCRGNRDLTVFTFPAWNDFLRPPVSNPDRRVRRPSAWALLPARTQWTGREQWRAPPTAVPMIVIVAQRNSINTDGRLNKRINMATSHTILPARPMIPRPSEHPPEGISFTEIASPSAPLGTARAPGRAGGQVRAGAHRLAGAWSSQECGSSADAVTALGPRAPRVEATIHTAVSHYRMALAADSAAP